MQGNLLLMPNNQLYVISKKTSCPTLAFFNLTSLDTKQFSYQEQNCTYYSNGYVRYVGNGQIAYAAGEKVFLIDENTFKLKETLKNQLYPGNQYQNLDTFYDKSENSSAILLKDSTSNFKILVRDSNSSQFSEKGKFYDPTKAFNLLSLNQGVSFEGTRIYEWQDMSQNIVTLQFRSDDQYLGGMETLAVSQNQQLIALVSSERQTINFYQLQTNYTMNRKISITISQSFVFTDNTQAQFTEDNMYLFIQTYNSQKMILEICKIDIQNQNYTFVMDPSNNQTSNCTSFGLLNSNQFDRFILTCTYLTYDNQTNTTSVDYTLELRKISDLQLIKSVRQFILLDKPVFKLITSSKWSQSFVLQIIDGQIEQKEDQCQTILYKLIIDQMISIQSEFGLSYHRIKPVGNYLVSLKFILNSNQTANSLKVYYAKNLSLLSEIQVQSRIFDNINALDSYLYSHGEWLLLQKNFDTCRLDFYDFSSNSEDSWYQGSLFKKYFQKSVQSQLADHIILPGRKLYYLYNAGSISLQRPSKIIYNMDKLPVKRFYDIQKSTLLPQSYLYIHKENPKCSIVFYFANKILSKFEYCAANQVQKINVDHDDRYSYFSAQKIFLASSQKHIILVYSVMSSLYIIEVREISQPGVLIFSYSTNSRVYNVDYSSTGFLIYNDKQYIVSTNIGINELAKEYQLNNFNLFDINKKGAISMAGPLITEPSKSKIILKNSIINEQYTYLRIDAPLDLIKIDQKNLMFTIYYNQTIQVWSNNHQFIKIFSSTKKDVKSLKFAGLNSLLVQSLNGTQIINFASSKIIGVNKEDNPMLKTKYDISDDGKMYAKIADLKTIVIQSIQDKNAGTVKFTLPEDEIATGLSFSSNNTLLISSQLGSLYYLSPNPCPYSYISNNLVCECRPNSTLEAGICKCKQTFQEVNEVCLCQQSFNITSQGKCQCLSKFIDNGVCIKCQFPCLTCQKDAKNCLSYSTGFYILIIGCCFIFVSIVAIILLYIRRKREDKKIDANRLNEDFDEI